MELQVPSYVYKNGVAKKVIGIGKLLVRMQNMITHGTGSAVSITMERIATDMLYKVILPDTLCYVMHHMHFQQISLGS